MSDWTRPPEGAELRELEREHARPGAPNRGWYAAAFCAGVVLVCLLGFATDLFDSGPTDLDVSKAYRSGFDQGVADAEDYWERELNERWWEGYKRGQASETSMAPVIVEATRDGFSWEAGYQAGLQSPDVDLDASYREGWMAGYQRAWTQVAGMSIAAESIPDPPDANYAERALWSEWGGEP